MSLKIVKHIPHVPSLQEVATCLQEYLSTEFQEASVSVTSCPDLMKDPFHLAASGLSGSPAVCDVGGVPYLVPLAQIDRSPYSMKEIARQLGYSKQAFFVGAAAGPFPVIGTNSELMPNYSINHEEEASSGVVRNETHFAKLSDTKCDDVGRGYTLGKIASSCDQFCLLGNLFLSEGRQDGEIIKIAVKTRLTADNFVTAIRKGLQKKFDKLQITMGGVFIMKKGKAKVHVMPGFSKTPLCSDEDVNNWLKFFEASAPLICLTAFHSVDPGQDLRIEHTHCFSKHGEGGHYHYDTTPEEVEYEAYLNVAERVFRIDAPLETHGIGRDWHLQPRWLHLNNIIIIIDWWLLVARLIPFLCLRQKRNPIRLHLLNHGLLWMNITCLTEKTCWCHCRSSLDWQTVIIICLLTSSLRMNPGPVSLSSDVDLS